MRAPRPHAWFCGYCGAYHLPSAPECQAPRPVELPHEVEEELDYAIRDAVRHEFFLWEMWGIGCHEQARALA